ncbi:hypothetical protein LP417_01880 [Polaromonas sp. P1-6]|nr:hypothetical protein LP417_01880 [Polaromonas sp. P1-6]
MGSFFVAAIGFFAAPIPSLLIGTFLWAGVFALRKRITGKPDSDNLIDFLRRPVILYTSTMGVGAVIGYYRVSALMGSWGYIPGWGWYLIQSVMWLARGHSQGRLAMHPTNEYSIAAGNIVGLWMTFSFLKLT